MADDMCGPSNGAKNLLSHVDRDRSIYQDRVIGAPGSSNQGFRTQVPTNRGDDDFQNFLAAPAGPQAGHSVPGMIQQFNDLHVAPHPGPGMGVVYDRAGNAGMSVDQYQRFLHGMNGQPGVSQSSIGNPFQQGAGVAVNPQTVMGAPVARNINHNNAHLTNFNAPGNFIGQSQGQGFNMLRPVSIPLTQQTGSFAMANPFGQTASYNMPVNARVNQTDPALAFPAAAYDAAFAEFDDAEFEDERQKWMDKHGPAAELAHQRAAEPTSAEWEGINANMEDIADASDAARAAGSAALYDVPAQVQDQDPAREEDNSLQAQQELVKAATDILSATDHNKSEKFKNSTFLELMRRIRAEEITIINKSLVDVQTGDEISIMPQPNYALDDRNTSVVTSHGSNDTRDTRDLDPTPNPFDGQVINP